MRFHYILFSIFVYATYTQAQTIQGRVFDNISNESLPFATIKMQGKNEGTQSDENGNYMLTVTENGLYNIEVSYVGYKNKTLFEIPINTARTAIVDIGLDKADKALDEVVIKVENFVKPMESPLSLRQIGTNEIQRNAGSNRDISKVLQTLPGVASNNSFRNDIIIRGGATSENRFYIDEVEVPNINHFATQGGTGGPVGMINVDFIRNVDFYSGAFPANRGNTLSSVFDFELKKGRTDRYAGTATIGASEAGLSLEGPTSKTSSILVSARQSYLQFLFKALELPFLPTFNDFQLKWNYKINNQNEINIIGLGAIDRNKLNLTANQTEQQRYILDNLPESNQWNYTNGIVYKHYRENAYYTIVLSRNMLNNESLKYEKNDNTDSNNLILKYASQEIENKLRIERTQRINGYKINVGVGYEYAKNNNTIYNRISTPQGLQTITYQSNIALHKYAIFAQVSKSYYHARLNTSFGIRIDGNSFAHSMRNPLSQAAPRLSLSYALTDRISINFNTGMYYQMPLYTSLSYKENNTLVNKRHTTRYIRCMHLVQGFDWRPLANMKISIEGFYKQYANYPFLLRDSISLANFGANFGVIGNEPITSSGRGSTYGIEILAQQKLYRGLYGIVAYTLSRGQFEYRNGKTAPTAYDSRHILNLTIGKKLKRNWEIGAKFRLQSALPYTPYDLTRSSTIAVWNITAQGVFDYTQLNTLREQTAHQLDIRIDKKWFLKRININVYLDIQNIYNQQTKKYPILDVQRDTNLNPIVNPNNPNQYLMRYIENTNGRILPSIGVIIEL